MLSADQARQYQAAQKNTKSAASTKSKTSSTTTTSNTSSSSLNSSPLDPTNYFNTTGKEKLDITKDEMERIEKCMKDPEFLKLFEDYVNEISDPNALRETDMYIKQLEKEGTSLPKEIVIPKACFCIQCGTEDKKGKNHIVNVCSSDSVEIYKEEKTKKGSQSGTQFSVPLVVGNPKVEEKQVVLDVVFNTKTCEKAEKDILFKDFICGMALDYVEQKCNVKLKKQYYTMMLGVKSVGEPSAMTVQAPGQKGQTVNKKDPLAPQNVLKDIQESREKATLNHSTEEKELKLPKEEPTTKKSNLIQEVNDPITPKYEIVYRNSFDMSEYTYSAPTATNRAKPSEIGIRIFLPMLDSISGVDLDVSENFLKLDCTHPQKYHLDLHLPYSVLTDKVSAKFEKKTKTLKVNLLVTPDALQKVVFEELPKEEQEEEKPLVVEESSKVEQVAETITDIPQKDFKLSKTPSPNQFSSFVQKTPQEIDIAATELKPVHISSESTNVNRVEVKDTKKSVSFASSVESSETKPTKPASEFKNKYLFELD